MKVVLAFLVGIALLLIVGAAISPEYVPWPRVAAGLSAHRLDLVALGFGAAGIALVLFCLHLLAP